MARTLPQKKECKQCQHVLENHPLQFHKGGCQNYDPFLGALNLSCRIMVGIQKRTIILATTRKELLRKSRKVQGPLCWRPFAR